MEVLHRKDDAATNSGSYDCGICGLNFKSRNSRNHHVRRSHGARKQSPSCQYCGKTSMRGDNLVRHERTCDGNLDIIVGRGISQRFFDESLQIDHTMRLTKTAHEGNFKEFTKNLFAKKNFFDQLRSCIIYDCRGILKTEKRNLKFSICVRVKFHKAANEAILTEPPIFFQTRAVSTCDPAKIEKNLAKSYEELVERINSFQSNGSGWTINTIESVTIKVSLMTLIFFLCFHIDFSP